MSKYNPSQFDDIRPYYDSEIPAAMKRIVDSDFFGLLCTYVYPGHNPEDVRQMMCSFKTIRDFQLEVMRCVNEQVIARSITDFTYSGVEQLDPKKKYLFISNHRDIMLDACLLQYILYKNGHETTEITFGANLMSSPLVIDIGKANKMFRVERGGNMKDFYQSSKHLSDYIRYVLTEKGQGLWIAQRNGRTKDGYDQTDQGGRYIKKPGEDLTSILTGIAQPKGRVNITFCPQLTEADLRQFENSTNNEYHRQVAQLIDERIIDAYQLTPNNYIAHDLRYGQQRYCDYYSDEEYSAFETYLERLNTFDIPEPDVLRDIYLGIYANPVDSKRALLKGKNEKM